MFLCQQEVLHCKKVFQTLTKKFFGQQQKGNRISLQRLLKSWVSDGVYDVKALEHALTEQFGSTSRMFDTPKSLVSGWRVAVTASSITDGSPYLFTNYNGEAPPRRKDNGISSFFHKVVFRLIVAGYGCIRPDIEDETFVWQV